jgi:hypothetical protein
MEKRQLHHLYTKLRWLKPRYLLILTLLLLLISVMSLRSNNEHMLKLRSAVYSADQKNGNVTQALQKLQAYVTTNMNTNLDSGEGTVYPPIQLKYTYQRLSLGQVQSASGANSDLYTAAQQYCQQQDSTDFSGRNRVPCIEQYVNSHGSGTSTIPTSLYEFDFASPKWSPDLAGWSLVLTLIATITTVAAFALSKLAKR